MSILTIEDATISEPPRRRQRVRPADRAHTEDMGWVDNIKGARAKKALLRFLLRNF